MNFLEKIDKSFDLRRISVEYCQLYFFVQKMIFVSSS
jgi:hypothetical protein